MRKFSLAIGSIVFLIAGCVTNSCQAASLLGKVVAADGSAARGADVYLFENDMGKPVGPKTTKTDDIGSFHFDAPVSDGGQLIAFAPGSGAAILRVQSNQPIEMHLNQPTDLTICFVDSDSKPVKNVPVRIRVIRSGSNLDYIVLPAVTLPPFGGKTNDEGAVTFSGLPQGYEVFIAMDDERFSELEYVDNNIRLSKTVHSKRPPIQLRAAGSISGKIIMPNGTPPAGLQVTAMALVEGRGYQGFSQADGNYHLHQLPAGEYSVSLMLQQSDLAKTWTAVGVDKVEVVAGQTKEGIDFTLIGGGILTGTVVAEDTGNPIAKVPIGINGPAHPQGGGQTQTAFTGADGAFSVHVPPGEQHLYIQMNRNALIGGCAIPYDTNRTVVVEDGKTASVEYRLPKAASANAFSIRGDPNASISPGLRATGTPLPNKPA
jgi:hypothetical protein